MMTAGARYRRGFSDSSIAGVNIVPVIDLCLVLLVILLIVSPLLDKPPVDVTLPEATTAEEKEDNISITINPDGKIALDTEIVSRQELEKFLKVLIKEQGENILVVIRSDKDVQYGELTKLLKTAKDAGARRISLGTEKPKDEEEEINGKEHEKNSKL